MCKVLQTGCHTCRLTPAEDFAKMRRARASRGFNGACAWQCASCATGYANLGMRMAATQPGHAHGHAPMKPRDGAQSLSASSACSCCPATQGHRATIATKRRTRQMQQRGAVSKCAKQCANLLSCPP